MANVFLEPSTRTASSFNAAFSRLGGKVITIQEGTSSTKKGETLQDTMRCVECYSDVLVLRHPETGAAQLAAILTEQQLQAYIIDFSGLDLGAIESSTDFIDDANAEELFDFIRKDMEERQE